MKTTLTFFSLLMAFTFSSCELVKEATETEFDGNIAKTINIDVTADDPVIHETILVNMKEDEEVEKHFDKVRAVDIQTITLQVVNLNTTGENKLTDGTLSYSAITNETETVLYSIPSVDLDALSSGNPLELNITEENRSKMEALLLSPGYLTFYLRGNVEQVPSSLTLHLTLKTKVKAGL